MKNEIYVKDWISYKEAKENGYKEFIGEICRSFDNGMRGQKDYFDCINEDSKIYYEELRKSIIQNKIKISGRQHQEEDYIPLFSDNTVGVFSLRAWGGLMAAVWSEEENKDYSYMDFYC